MFFSSSSYLKKLLTFGIMLGTVPVIILGLFSFFKTSDIIQKRVNEANEQVVQQIKLNVEQVLGSVDKSITDFAGEIMVENAIKSSLNVSSFENVNAITNLFSGMNRLQRFGTGISDIYIISFEQSWFMNNKGFSRFNDSMEVSGFQKYRNIPEYSIWTKSDMEEDQDESNIQDKNGVQDENNVQDKKSVQDKKGIVKTRDINLIKKVPLASSGTAGVIVTEISQNYLEKMVFGKESAGNILILDRNYSVILEKKGNLGNALDQTESFINLLKNKNMDSGYITEKISKTDWGITFVKSEYSGWTYASIVSINQITQEMVYIGQLTLAICLFTMLFLGVLAVIGSRKLYMPIYRIYESLLGQTKYSTEAKGSDELQFIGEYINSQEKAKSLMKKIIEGQTSEIKEFFIHKLLRGQLKPDEDNIKAELYGYDFSFKWLCLLVVQIDTMEGTPFQDHDRDLAIFAINNIVNELISQELKFETTLMGEYQVTLLKSDAETVEEAEDMAYSQACRIQDEINNYLRIKVSIGMSRVFSDMAETSKAYKEGIEALKYRIRLEEESILSIKDILPGYNVNFSFPEQMISELIDTIKLVDEEKVNNLLKHLINELFKEKRSIIEYQISLIKLFLKLTELPRSMGKSVPELYGDSNSLLHMIFELKTAKEVEKWFKHSIIKPLIKLFEDQGKVQKIKISQEIVNIIEKEYDTDISLEMCALRLKYHPNYVSRVFHEATGYCFKDYLASFRLEISKKLLMETDMKVSEISQKLRYNNSQNFIRYFKNLLGVTPGQYREMNKQNY